MLRRALLLALLLFCAGVAASPASSAGASEDSPPGIFVLGILAFVRYEGNMVRHI